MEIKCVLFDVDGVIINCEKFSSQYCKKYDISIEDMRPFFQGDFQDCLIGRAGLKKVVKPHLLNWNWKGAVDDFLINWFQMEHHIDARIIDLVKKLKTQNIKHQMLSRHKTRKISHRIYERRNGF